MTCGGVGVNGVSKKVGTKIHKDYTIIVTMLGVPPRAKVRLGEEAGTEWGMGGKDGGTETRRGGRTAGEMDGFPFRKSHLFSAPSSPFFV